MFLLNSKISDLQCYCATSAMVTLKTFQSQLEEVWVHPSATATVANQAMSKGKCSTTGIEITDL